MRCPVAGACVRRARARGAIRCIGTRNCDLRRNETKESWCDAMCGAMRYESSSEQSLAMKRERNKGSVSELESFAVTGRRQRTRVGSGAEPPGRKRNFENETETENLAYSARSTAGAIDILTFFFGRAPSSESWRLLFCAGGGRKSIGSGCVSSCVCICVCVCVCISSVESVAIGGSDGRTGAEVLLDAPAAGTGTVGRAFTLAF